MYNTRTDDVRASFYIYLHTIKNNVLFKEIAKGYFFIGPTTKRRGGGKGRTTKEKELFLKLLKKFRKKG